MTRSGGELVVDTLVAHGITAAFGVPGESYLEVLDALHDVADELRFVPCRHEGGAAFMAEAWGKLTGSPGVCMVTRGPGATNASIGVHTAAQNSSPLLLLVGQVGTDHRGREAFQEVDYHQFFGGIAKAVFEIDDADRVSEVVARALALATTGRPGPVVVALPEDVLRAESAVAPTGPRPTVDAAPGDDEIRSVRRALRQASRPLLLVGGGGWTDQGRADVVHFAEASHVPAVAAFRFHDLFDNTSECYAGEAGVAMPPAVADTLRGADLILALGVRFGEMTTGAWELLTPPRPGATILHVHASGAELNRIFEADVAIEATPSATAAALRDRPIDPSPEHTAWRDECRARFLDTLTCPPQLGALDMGEVTTWLHARLPDDMIITNGAGNFSVWPNKFLLYGPHARLLAPQSGAMGYGLPAAIAARLAHPDRRVVCFAGDGDLQMTIAELGTAAQEGLQPIVLVIDNAMYGTIRMHQERRHPGRVVGTDIVNPDFVALARSYGFHAEAVRRTEDFPDAFARAEDAPTGALLHLHVDGRQLTPWTTLDHAVSPAPRARR